MQAENEGVEERMNAYRVVIAKVTEMVEGITDVESANKCLNAIAGMEHVLTSKKEAGKILNDKAKSLGLTYDRAAGAYVAGEAK